jgi:hypothetical protein
MKKKRKNYISNFHLWSHFFLDLRCYEDNIEERSPPTCKREANKLIKTVSTSTKKRQDSTNEEIIHLTKLKQELVLFEKRDEMLRLNVNNENEMNITAKT